MFWDERVWLPPNTTWQQISPGPDKNIIYADHKHLVYSLPLALLFLCIRFILEKYCFAPFAGCLGIQNTRKKAANNQKIKYMQQCAFSNLVLLWKAWRRLCHSQNKPSELDKFCETLWRLSFNLTAFCYGLCILWDKEWLWNIDNCYIGYPHQGLTNDIWWYYMVSFGYYWALSISHFCDLSRKDYWQKVIHHLATIALMSMSWMCNLYRIGAVVLFLHEVVDILDILLNAAKSAKYALSQKPCDRMFVVFTIVWITIRLCIFPCYMLWCVMIRGPMLMPIFPADIVLAILLYVIQALHLFWTWIYLKVAYKAISAAKRLIINNVPVPSDINLSIISLKQV